MSIMKILRMSALGLVFASSSIAASAIFTLPASAAVLAKVNGQAITDVDLKIAEQDLGPRIPRQLKGKARDSYVLDYLIDAALVAQKAEAEKLDKTANFPRKLAYYREKLLMDALLTKVGKDAATDAAMKKVYEAAAARHKPQVEIHARHILVPTKAQAEKVLKELKSGESFSKVEKAVSKTPGAGGGDLGWFTKNRMVPAFADAAFKLKIGQYSDPVKTPFGWHIIQVEGRRETKFPPFDKVKGQVFRFVAQRAQNRMIAQLRKTAKVQHFGAMAPSAAPAVPAAKKAPAAKAPATKK